MALSYTERDIVGRGLSITTMVVTFLCIRYRAIWRLGMGLRYGEVWDRTARFEGAPLRKLLQRALYTQTMVGIS